MVAFIAVRLQLNAHKKVVPSSNMHIGDDIFYVVRFLHKALVPKHWAGTHSWVSLNFAFATFSLDFFFLSRKI